jgi:hypothetical protein
MAAYNKNSIFYHIAGIAAVTVACQYVCHSAHSIWVWLMGFLGWWAYAIGIWVWHWRLLQQATYRATHNFCPKCGYNLRGTTSGVCPECGELVGHDPRFRD